MRTADLAPPCNPTEWLSRELDRVWLLAEDRLRQSQRAQLAAQPDHPSIAGLEGILTARRSARVGRPADVIYLEPDHEEVARSCDCVSAQVLEERKVSPVGMLAAGFGLRPLEVEALMVAVAPHIDPPLADLFALIRHSRLSTGVDTALLANVLRLTRWERTGLLDVLDPKRPLLARKLIELTREDWPQSVASCHYRAITPSLDLVAAFVGRPLPELLERACTLTVPDLEDSLLDALASPERLGRYCGLLAEAVNEGRWRELPTLVLSGGTPRDQALVAGQIAALAQRALLAVDVRGVGDRQIASVVGRAQDEALYRGAVLYVARPTREVVRQLRDLPTCVIIGAPPAQAKGAFGRATFELELVTAISQIGV